MTPRLNLMAPEMLADPYPTYAELRRTAPVCQVDPAGFWAVTRYDDAALVLRTPEIFSSEGFRSSIKPPWIGHNPFGDSMVTLDPPAHGRLRSLVNRAFGPTALAELEPRVRAFADGIVARLPMDEPIDWVMSAAMALPASVIGELLGLEASLHSRFKRWTDDMTSISGVTPDQTERIAEIRTTVREMEDYMTEVLARRRREPANDMVSQLLHARAEGDSLSDAELISFLFLLLTAGLETTTHLLNHTVLELMRRPEVLARVQADLSLIPKLVEELLRYEPPVKGVYRLVLQDTDLGGVHITKGSKVLVLLGSANRDEAQFDRPDQFDMDRPGNNMFFGHGIHFCLGAPLARLEARLLLSALLPRIRGFSPAGPVTWRRSLSIRGPLVLPIIVHAAR